MAKSSLIRIKHKFFIRIIAGIRWNTILLRMNEKIRNVREH